MAGHSETEYPAGVLGPIWVSIGKAIGPVVAPYVAKQLSALVPVIVAAAIDTLIKRVPLIGGDLPNLGDLAEDVRKTVNLIPDIDIPVLSDIFDLSEWLKSRE